MREIGYYWVRLSVSWYIAEYTGGEYWLIVGKDSVWHTGNFHEINETRILNPNENDSKREG